MQQVEIGAEGGRRLLIQLVEGIALHARVEQVGIAKSDAGQEVVRQEKEGRFEVFADLVGFNDLGRQHDQEGVSLKTERVQVDGAGAAALVADDGEEGLHPVGLPVDFEYGVVQDQDIVLELRHPSICLRQNDVGHLEVFQALAVCTIILVRFSHNSMQFSLFNINKREKRPKYRNNCEH